MASNEHALSIYAERHCSAEPPVLQALRAETLARAHAPGMLSSHAQGRLLALFSHLTTPRTVVELGTYTGYGTLCLAEGLAPGGIVHTIDIDDQWTDLLIRHAALAGVRERIVVHTGAALDMLPRIPGPFDLVFIDADKAAYPTYFDAVVDRVRSGGLILADNVLRGGRVLLPIAEQDPVTRAISAFNHSVRNDPRVEVVLFPQRDGLSAIRRK